MTDFETLFRDEQAGQVQRLARLLGGDHQGAEDLWQEAQLRAWRALPRDVEPDHQRAWLHRTARNLAIDELRRRGRRPVVPLEHAYEIAGETETPGPDAAREALAHLGAHERFVLLLRFQAGFAHAEIAALLGVTDEAARKRVARARANFVSAYRAARADLEPLIVLVARGELPDFYVRWLEDAGARVRLHPGLPTERELALADGLVLTGHYTDLHSGLYGETARNIRGEPDLAGDRQELAVVGAALALDLPVVGICRGHQLLNIASGGSLYQDVVLDGATRQDHDVGHHRLQTHSASTTRALLGNSTYVHSEHHQAVRELGRNLRVAATSPDGLAETIERTDKRFALGLQWHPETDPSGGGSRVAEALLDAALGRAA